MQILNAAPRDTLTVAQVRALLTGDTVTVTPGLDLLNTSNVFVEDISADLVSGEVARNNYADVHGSCSLSIMRELAWGRSRVRPFMVLADGAVSARFNLGVFVLTTPDSVRGDDVATFTVGGFDLMHLLQTGPGDTYVAASGVTYFTAIQAALTAAVPGSTLTLDGTRQATTLPSTMVWALTPDQPASWIRIINDLLDAIGYRGLWVDYDGVFRSAPYADPATRTVEWTFNTADVTTDLVGEDRSLASDVWAARNWWRFVRKVSTAQPVEGNGIYTVTNASTGRTSVAALGRTVRAPVQFLDAADHASLVSQGDRIVSGDQATSRVFTITVDPLPVAGHFDVVQFLDAGESDKCQVSAWTLPMDGSPGRWTLQAVSA